MISTGAALVGLPLQHESISVRRIHSRKAAANPPIFAAVGHIATLLGAGLAPMLEAYPARPDTRHRQ